MRHFTNLIQDNEKSFCSLLDGVRALELVIAAKQSAKQGKKIHLN
jgi:predicted dehydrogenase